MSELVTIILTGVLVIVTGIYAWRTFAISKATKKQADAMEKSVAEMVRPMVHPSVSFSQEVSGKIMCTSFKNIGRGPALHVEANIRHPYFERFEGPLPGTILEVGQQVRLDIPTVGVVSQERFELIAKYQNVYGRWFRSRVIQDEHGQYHLEYDELESKG